MPLTQLVPPYPIFTDRNGDPLDAGYLYFGEVNENPETNPIQVYWDVAFTQPVAQPIRTINGYPSRAGSPAAIYANSSFSVTVRNKRNELVIYSASGYGISPGTTASRTDQIIYNQGATAAVDRVLTSRLQDIVSVKDFGAVGDGVTDDTAEIQAALNYGIANGKAVYMPSGVYMFGGPPINPTFINGKSLSIFGDGPELTIIKEIPGSTQVRGSFNATFYFAATNVTVPQISVRNLTCDKSGSGTIPSTPGSFQYQQAHCFSVFASGTGVINKVIFENVVTKDKIGAGINLSAGQIDQAFIQNVHGIDFLYTGGQRGDLEFQASVGQLTVVGCSGLYVQSEPNVLLPFGGIRPTCHFINCDYTIYDMLGYDGDQDAQTYIMTGCTNGPTGEFWVRFGIFFANDCTLRTTTRVDWRNATSTISDSTIIIGHDTTTDTFQSLYISGVGLLKQDHIFSNCKFVSDSTASATTTGYAVINLSPLSVGANYKVTFRDCTFDPVFQYTANCYRAGTFVFDRCTLASRLAGWAIRTGGDATFISNVTIDSCNLSQISGSLVELAAAGASAWRLTFAGVMDYAKFSMTNRPATEYQDTKVTHNGYWLSDARPAAGGLNGQIVKLRKPTVGSASEFVVSTGNITTATFRSTAQAGINRGISGSRPAPTANDIGVQYLDTTLDADGKPIWWTGTAWVDATGLVV